MSSCGARKRSGCRLGVEEGMLHGSSLELTRWKRWALLQADDIDPVLSGQVLEHLYISDLDGG